MVANHQTQRECADNHHAGRRTQAAKKDQQSHTGVPLHHR